MTFLHPLILAAGLGLIAIPILIHLLMRRRRKPVPWGAMRFLLEAYKTQRRRMTLEQMLLLLVRCLLVALLGMAIARPMIGAGAGLGSNARTLVVLLDNSITSDLTDEGGQTALERHKALVAGALERLDPARGDRASIITLGAPARGVALPPTADIAGVVRALASIEGTDSAPDFLGASETLASVLEAQDDNAPPVSVLIASEFRAGQGVGRSALPSLGDSVEALLVTPPPAPASGNIAIEALEPMRTLVVASGASGGLGTGQARVTLRRSGSAIGRSEITSVRLVSDLNPSLVLGEGRLSWSPGQSEGEALVSLDAEALSRAGADGALVLRAEIDPDELSRDNTRRRAIEVRDSIRVGIAAPGRYAAGGGVERYTPSDWLRLALSPGEQSSLGGIQLEQIEPGVIDASRLSRLDALALPRPDLIDNDAWDRISAFARAGGLVIAMPPNHTGAQLWTDRFTSSLGLRLSIEREPRAYTAPMGLRPGDSGASPLLSMIGGELEFLAQPVRVRRLLPIAIDPQGGASAILSVEDGAPLVVASAPSGDEGGRGLVVLFAVAFDPEWTDLPTKPLLVPLMQEIVRQGAGRARGSFGGPAGARVSAPPSSVELAPIGASGASIPLDENGLTREPIRTSGAWRAIDQRGAARAVVVVNPDTRATLADPEDAPRVERWLATLAPEIEVQWIDPSASATLDANTTSIAQALAAPRRGREYAWIIFSAALGLGLVELVLARICSHADLRDASAPPQLRSGA